MKIGVISDVHANAPALEAVLNRLSELEVDRVFCAGDVVGYYPFPDETISLFIDHDVQSVLGNHDAAVIGETPPNFNITAKRAIDWTRRTLSISCYEYLESLPVVIEEDINEREMFIVHGSPREKLDEYVWKENVDQGIIDFWFSSTPDFVILGHTHRPFVKSVGEAIILNPGSVGQPRDGDPKASFAVIDLKALNVDRYRVDYEIDKVARKTLEYLPRKLADRLYEGR